MSHDEINSESIIWMYEKMLTIRRFEEQARREADAGKLRGIHSSIGQEAVPTGVCAQLRDEDFVLGTHRSHHHCIAKGVDLNEMMAELLGKSTGTGKGKGGTMHIADITKGMLGANGIVGSNIPVATGVALTAKVKGTDNVSVVSTTGFEFGFNEEINPSTILTNSNSATCDGYSATIQTSPDNFSTNTNCIQLGTATTSDNKTFSIIPTNLINSLCPTFYSSSCGSNLMPDTNYQIKVTSQVKDLAGNTLNGGNDNLSNFTSKGRPYVSSTSPDNGSIDVRENGTIVLHFSKSMT